MKVIKKQSASTKVIKSPLQDINVNASERPVRRKIKDLKFKAWCTARKPKLTPAIKAKRLNWTKQWRDKDVDFWRSTVEHSTKIMIWSVTRDKGTGRLYVFNGMKQQD
ncbi:hypothetical protein TNCV_3225151 [Trichonephila clavipes]|nr:hypothetical protein TNCV_3225151 [Trichonephila clavipes]